MAGAAIPAVSLVCFDLTGTVVDDEIVERAFAEAIATLGIVAGTEAYTRAMVRYDRGRGRPPADILREIFADNESRAQAAALAFDRSFSSVAERFDVAASLEALAPLGKVPREGRRICPITTLSRDAAGPLLDQLLERLQDGLPGPRLDLQPGPRLDPQHDPRLGPRHRGGPVDLVLCADDAPRGFPWPDLVLTAGIRAGIADVREVAMVSATEAGLRAGSRAGAGMVIGVTRNRKRLPAMREAGASHIVDEIAALPELLAAC